jgi:hypothetical protein
MGLDQMKLTVLATALLLASSGAMAAPPAEQSAPAEQAATASSPAANAAETPNPDDEKKVCRTERATGSLTRRTRVCMTAAQWREVNSRTYRGVTEMQSSAAGGTNSSFSSQGSGQ